MTSLPRGARRFASTLILVMLTPWPLGCGAEESEDSTREAPSATSPAAAGEAESGSAGAVVPIPTLGLRVIAPAGTEVTFVHEDSLAKLDGPDDLSVTIARIEDPGSSPLTADATDVVDEETPHGREVTYRDSSGLYHLALRRSIGGTLFNCGGARPSEEAREAAREVCHTLGSGDAA